MDDKNYYEILDDFMVRTPIMPFNNYKKLWDLNYIRKTFQDESFKEGIRIASNSMYEGIKKNSAGDEVVKSEMKYLDRAMFRTVPFGIFCGISIGKFNDDYSISFNKDRIVKKIRPDYSWIVDIIKKIEIKFKGYRKLKLYTNTVIEEDGNKFVNRMHTCFWYYNNLREEGNKATYINRKPNIIFILELLKNGAFYDEIIDEYRKRNVDVKEEVLDKFIEGLIKDEFIYTEIRPAFKSGNMLQHIIDIVENRNLEVDFLDKLKNVNYLMNEYNKLGKNSGLKLIQEIEKEMALICKEKVYIQVDSTNPFKIELDKSIKKDLVNLINFLVKFSGKNSKYNDLYKFVEKFKEKYGEYREIPLMEAMDTVWGVGYENSFDEAVLKETSKDIYLEEKIYDAIINNTDVCITDEDIEKFKDEKIIEDDLYDSIELYCTIHAKDINDLKNKNYFLSISANAGSNCAGSTLGRFSYLDRNINRILEKIRDKEKERLKDDYIRCDITYIHPDARSNNVSITDKVNDYEISLCPVCKNEKTKNIDVHDIYIGIEQGRAYIKSKKYNKRIKLVTNNMLNNESYYGFARLMREISEGNERKSPLNFISRQISRKEIYTPRIMYKNIILLPKTWRINKNSFNSERVDYIEFKNKVDFLKTHYNMENVVYYMRDDQLILVNLKKEKYYEILYKDFKKQDSVCFREIDLEDKWIKAKDDCYKAEFVFEFVKNKFKSTDKALKKVLPVKSPVENLKIRTIDKEKRYFGIFSEWMYLKIYNDPERTSELLGEDLRCLIENLKGSNLISKWFYIRYADEDKHIRLRLNIKDYEKNYTIVLKQIHEWAETERTKKLIGRIVLDQYEREIERYGGEKLIENAEEVFMCHSLSIIEFLHLRRNKKIQITAEEFAVCSIINLMELLGINYEKQFEIFDCIIDKTEKRNEYSKVRKRYIGLCNSNNDFKNLKEIEGGYALYSLMNIGREYIIQYGRKIDILDDEGKLTNYKTDILLSIIHMFCNRLFDINREKEREVMVYTRHTLYALKFFKRDK